MFGRCTASTSSTSLKRINVVADAANVIMGSVSAGLTSASKSDEKEKPMKQVQKKISGFLLDKQIVSGINKKDREKAKELKEQKEAKEAKEAK